MSLVPNTPFGSPESDTHQSAGSPLPLDYAIWFPSQEKLIEEHLLLPKVVQCCAADFQAQIAFGGSEPHVLVLIAEQQRDILF